MKYTPEQLRQWAEFVAWDEPDYRKPSVSDIRNQLDAHADALEERGELIEALKLIVELDKDAHPGLSTWHDARVKADQDARALLARIGE